MSDWKLISKAYIYDNTFEGLLTIVFNVFETKLKPVKIVSCEKFTPTFIDNTEIIKTDLVKSGRVFNGILEKISDSTLYNLYTGFLSDNENKELNILEYIILGFEHGPKIDNMLHFDSVLFVQKLVKQVGYEVQRFRGFVRFTKINNNLFYSKICPDNNIIELVGKFFTKRLSNQNFIIHDEKRDIAFLYNTTDYTIVDASTLQIPKFSDEEILYKELWKTFFKTIAITERKNSRQQLSYMPRRYWKNMFETE